MGYPFKKLTGETYYVLGTPTRDIYVTETIAAPDRCTPYHVTTWIEETEHGFVLRGYVESKNRQVYTRVFDVAPGMTMNIDPRYDCWPKDLPGYVRQHVATIMRRTKRMYLRNNN